MKRHLHIPSARTEARLLVTATLAATLVAQPLMPGLAAATQDDPISLAPVAFSAAARTLIGNAANREVGRAQALWTVSGADTAPSRSASSAHAQGNAQQPMQPTASTPARTPAAGADPAARLAELERILSDAKAAYAQMQRTVAARDTAYAALEQAQDKVDATQKALRQAEAKLKAAQQDYVAASTRAHSVVMPQEVTDAKNALDDAQTDYQQAIAKQQEASTNLQSIQKRAQEASDAADAAQAKADAAKQAKADADAKVTSAKAAADAAKKAYDDASAGSETVVDPEAVAAAKKKLEKANADLTAAQSAQSAAASKLSAAEQAVSDAQSAVSSATSAQSEAEAAVASAQSKVDAAAAAQKGAQAAYDKAVADNKDQLADYNEALENAKDAKEKVDYYQEYVDRYEGELKDNQAKLAAAQKAYDDAVTKANGDAAKVKRGSYAFFESIGATDAVSILNNEKGYTDTAGKPFNQFNDPSNALDATSLENMRRALDMMDRCNELRRQNGLSELKVTSALMAVAQTDANWSSYNGDHAGMNGNDYSRGENLAWSYSDPFKVWYDEEKKEYESGNTNYQEIGHYLNIINKSYTVTGYGYSRYGNTDAQQFDFDADDLGDGTSYTVSEYRQLFEQYYQKVTGGVSSQDIIKAQDAVYSSELDVQTYKGIVKTQQDAYKEALAAAEKLAPKGVAEAQKYLTAANDALDAAKSGLAGAHSSKDSADAAVTQATAQLNTAQSAQRQAQAAQDAADAQVETAVRDVEAARKELAEAEAGKPVDIDAYRRAYEAAQQNLTQAQDDAVAKRQEANEAQQAASDAQQAAGDAAWAIRGARADYDLATDQVAQKKAAVTAAQATYEQALDAFWNAPFVRDADEVASDGHGVFETPRFIHIIPR